MFFGTVENIALGKSESTEKEIIAAAEEAGARFISNLPKGYNTVWVKVVQIYQAEKSKELLLRELF